MELDGDRHGDVTNVAVGRPGGQVIVAHWHGDVEAFDGPREEGEEAVGGSGGADVVGENGRGEDDAESRTSDDLGGVGSVDK